MITCTNCGKTQNMNIQPLSPPLANNSTNFNMPNLVTPIQNIQDMPAAESSPMMYPDTGGDFVNPSLPSVLPNLPYFQVPNNPLLPEGYQEILDYNSIQYMNGFLRTQIGKMTEVEFLVGSNNTVIHTGRLVAVGINFIILYELNSDSILTCDFYNIKFVRFYE